MTDKRPNFLLIIADDLGYSDLGCFGGEIKTPNIDRLARDGLRFSDYHTAPMCSVARSMVLSGTDSHVAMQQLLINESRSDRLMEGYLTRNIAALPELLKDAGYDTMISGKWHQGFRPGYLPSDRGFDKVFSCLPASSNHFGWDPKWEGGEVNRPDIHGHQPPIYVKQDKRWIVESNEDSTEDGFYSSKVYVDELLAMFNEREQSPSSAATPFFAYLPFTAPHYPLQCFAKDRDKYRGVYDDGPEVLRQSRLAGLKKEGLISATVQPHDVVSPDNAPWEELTAKEKKFSSRAMEIYAGMVDSMDQHIGRVLDHLEKTGQLDNTLVMFFSDNGAEGTALEAEEVVGPHLLETINSFYNNEYENLGNRDSFCWMGPRWCQASTAPNRLYKHYTSEGGVRVPMVMRYPAFDHLVAGSVCRSFTTAMDIVPTFLALAGVQHPNPDPAHPRATAPYHDRQVYPVRGRSWVDYLRDGHRSTGATWPNGNGGVPTGGQGSNHPLNGQSNGDARYSDDVEAIYGPQDTVVAWEHFGKAALRLGRWKIVNMPVEHPTGTGKWQLYDLYSDQGETNDLEKHMPDKVAELVREYEKWAQETGAPLKRTKDAEGNCLGGDIIGDQRLWMNLGNGKRFDEQDV